MGAVSIEVAYGKVPLQAQKGWCDAKVRMPGNNQFWTKKEPESEQNGAERVPKASQRAAELRQGGSQNTPWGTMPKKYEKVWSAWTLFGPISDQNYVKIEKTICQQALENYRQKTLKIYANRMPKSTQNRCQIAPEIYAKRSCGKDVENHAKSWFSDV